MRIALTYDLRDDYRALDFDEEAIAEFDSEETISALEAAIASHGHETVRLGNLWQLTKKLADGESWDLVFNICEGLYGLAREAQVPALLDAYGQAYVFSTPDVMMLCHHKAWAKSQIRSAGLATADSFLIHESDDCALMPLGYPAFAKPVAEGTGKGVSKQSVIENETQLEQVAIDLLARFRQPVLVETYLPGREFTIGITGTANHAEVIGVLEIILNEGAEVGGHTYANKENCETLVTYRLASDETALASGKLALEAYRTLGLRDGGRVDIRCDAKGNPHFLEVNPLAGLHPTHSDLPILAAQAGLSFEALIGKILDSAISRLPS